VPRVVVTGVAGAIGGRLAERLLARADVEQVVGIDLVAPSLSDPKLDMRVMDLAAPADEHALEAALDGADALIHLAWLTADGPGRAADAAAVASANHRALAGVLGAAAKSGVATVVHLSSATVYGAWPDNKIPLTEDARLRPNPEFSFAVSKAEAERQVAEWADGHPSVRVSVLRPTVVVGTDERPLYRALGITRTPRSGDGVRPVQYLHVDDLVSAVVLAWERRLSGVYNVAPDSGITEDEARALAGGVARLALPDRLADAVSSFGWRLWRTGIPAEARAYATSPWVVAPDRIKEEGWQPEYSSEEALVATDERMHWDDLPPGRRQNYNLLVALIALAGVGAGALAVLDFVRRRRRRA
jgi:nucleoside-diphosphate-sugar epimerase